VTDSSQETTAPAEETTAASTLPRTAEGVPVAHNNWDRYGLPEKIEGKSFIDVGCWEGVNCAEATKRGASQVVGVDLCTTDALKANVDEFGFEFVQLDILSEKWLELDTFDIVLCGGVLYHVENVISFLFRLRRITAEALYLETKLFDSDEDRPLMRFKPTADWGNPSNWWMPNQRCLDDMLVACGFGNIAKTWENEAGAGGGGGQRVCMRAEPVRQQNYERVLPRKVNKMPLAGGSRGANLKQFVKKNG
jgi:SAM-dependent methyltransferase